MLAFLLLLMVTACTASGVVTVSDLQHKCFIHPVATKVDFIKIVPVIQTFKAVTVCLRVKTDLCRDHALISGATSGEDNTILLFWKEDEQALRVYIQGHFVSFKGLNYELNKFHSICFTWDAKTGIVQLWIDGHYTPPKHVGGGYVSDPCIVTGQDQDSVGGGFDEHQSFVGELCDLHVWDSVLDVCDIRNYMDYQNFCPGNAVNWRHISYYATGRATTAPNQICTQEFRRDQIPRLSGSDGSDLSQYYGYGGRNDGSYYDYYGYHNYYYYNIDNFGYSSSDDSNDNTIHSYYDAMYGYKGNYYKYRYYNKYHAQYKYTHGFFTYHGK